MLPAHKTSTVMRRAEVLLSALKVALLKSLNCLQSGSAPDPFQLEAERLQDLMHDKGELLLRVQTLRQGLSDWRTKLDGQVRNYQQEMNTLNTDLKTEVGQLRTEFNDLRSTLRQQMELTVSLAKGETKAEAATTTAQKQTA